MDCSLSGDMSPDNLVFLYVFPLMGACCAQIKGFTLGFAPISGMWSQVFVKALPYTADRLTDKLDVMLAVGYNDHKTFLL